MRARDVAQLKVDQGLPPFPDLASRESIKERVHGIMVGEMQAMEGAGRSVYDFPDAPWEFTLDMARQVWDESRHLEIYLRLLEHLDGYVGEFPETTILWRCACAEDAAARVAGVNRGLEGLACDVFNQLVHIARKMGDPILERAVDFVLADEITHVRMGSKWLTKLTEGDPERRQQGHRVPGDHRRALQPGRRAPGRRPRRGADLDRDRGAPARRLHRRGDRAPHQDHPALPGLLASMDPLGRRRTPSSSPPGRVRHYRYATERMMRVLGGWLALTPEMSAKLLMGRHVWDNAQHADALGRRLPELRAHAQESEPANEAFVAFMDALESPETPERTVERLVGVYRVLKPHLLAAYERAPRQRQRGLRAAHAPDPRALRGGRAPPHRRGRARARAPRRRRPRRGRAPRRGRRGSAALLAAAGGVTGEGLPDPVAGAGLRRGRRRRRRSSSGSRRAPRAGPCPMSCAPPRPRLGDALVARDADGVRRWLAGEAVGSEAERRHARRRPLHRARDRGRRAHRRSAPREAPPRRPRRVGDVWPRAGRAAPEGWRVHALDVARVRARPLRLTARARERPRRQPRGDRAPGHPRLPRPGRPLDRGLLRGRRRLAPRPRRRPGRRDRPGAGAGELSQHRSHPRRRARDGRAGRPSRLRLPLRELALRQGVRGGGARLRRAVLARHPADGRQDRGAPTDARSGRAGRAGQRGRPRLARGGGGGGGERSATP